jgi:hypothetical protein
MNTDNEIVIKSFQHLIELCHDARSEPIRPIESKVEFANSEIPMLLPSVDDETLKPLLLSWYYAGYYSGRYQAIQELSQKK